MSKHRVSRERHVKIFKKSLLALLATLAPLDEEFPPIGDLPPDSVDL